MTLELSTKRVLVFGGGSGIGRVVALAAAKKGAKVCILGRRAEVLEATKSQIESATGQSISWKVTDATRHEEVEKTVAQVAEGFGGIDFAINSVGMNIKERSLNQLTPDNWARMIDGNLTAAFAITQAVIPYFRAQHDGLLIHISSVAAYLADGSGASYQASKAAVAALARATMFEERSNGVRVSVVYPGFTDTDFVKSRPTPPTDAELSKAMKPENIAKLCIALMELPAQCYVPELTIQSSL